MPLLWYGTLNSFTAINMYNQWMYQLFNVMFTAFPIINYALFDREHTTEILVANKKNYYLQGVKG